MSVLLLHSIRSSILQNNAKFLAAKSYTTSTMLVLTEEVGSRGVLTLNRPKSLNALSKQMVDKIAETLTQWNNSKSLVIVKSNGGKAFSAGGDVRSIVEVGSPDFGKLLFRSQYATSFIVGSLMIPYVALIDGVTMGAGVGMSALGRYCIATEKTLFAMPETAMGLHPDVGGSYILPRLQGRLGYYLGLTGIHLKGEDVFHAGIATHYCESAKLPKIEEELLKDIRFVGDVMKEFCPKPKSEFTLSKHLDQINKCFNAPSIEEILSNLKKDNSEWAKQTIKTLRSACPTSLKVTLRSLDLGSKLSFSECLQMEYRLTSRLIEDNNFREGVRALLITKDHKPKWSPPSIEDISQERVLSFFQPLPNNDALPIGVNLCNN